MPGKALHNIAGLYENIEKEKGHIAFQTERIRKYPSYETEGLEKIKKYERKIRIWKACLEALETGKSTWNV